MPYPEEAEGFQIDSADTWTTFHKRHVRGVSLFEHASRICADNIGPL